MNIFVINSGSSSIKYRLFAMPAESVLVEGHLERLGTAGARLHQSSGRTNPPANSGEVNAPDHAHGLQLVLKALTDPRHGGPLTDLGEIDGVGHRVVHGGADISGSVQITEAVIETIQRHVELAPLHNPPNLAGIRAAMEAIPNVPHVAVFDTAFLSTLPPRAYRYAVPTDWYTEHRVRRYGFHGTSHRYVAAQAAVVLGKPLAELNLITCHLGNGCSVTAVARGRAVDHSMGMTPLAGLMMGTRSGDLDPSVVLYMLERGLAAEEIGDLLNHASGLFGVSRGLSDLRDLEDAGRRGDGDAALAIEMFIYRVAKYIGSYAAILPDVDAVVLTGGIGENAAAIRAQLGELLHPLGVEIDQAANDACVGGATGLLTGPAAALPVWCIPTEEELLIARDTARVVDRGHAPT